MIEFHSFLMIATWEKGFGFRFMISTIPRTPIAFYNTRIVSCARLLSLRKTNSLVKVIENCVIFTHKDVA